MVTDFHLEELNKRGFDSCYTDSEGHRFFPFKYLDDRDALGLVLDSGGKLVAKLPAGAADPNGKDQHAPGAKLDAGKQRPALVLGAFAPALLEVVKVGTFGAAKYTDNGWLEVPNGYARYADAQMRHQLAHITGVTHDDESKLLHLAHEAWNSLAKLTLFLKERNAE